MGIYMHIYLRVILLVVVLMFLNAPIVQAANPPCGTTLTKNTKLDGNMTCASTALRLIGSASKKITLNCDGHSIDVASGSGIFASNVTGVTIQDCVISTSDYFSHGIVLSNGSTKNLIKDNTITTTGNSGRGIELRGSSSNTIKDNTVHTSNTGGNAIRLRSGSDKNLVKDNSLQSDASHVITIESSSKTKIYDNWLESPNGFLSQRNFYLQNGGLGVDDSGNIYAVDNSWGSSDGIGTATAFFMVDPATGLGNTVKPLLVGTDDIGFGFGALDVLPNGRILALPGFGSGEMLYEINPGNGQVTSIALSLPGSVSGNPNGLEATSNTSLLATTNTGELLNIDLNTNTITEIGSQGTQWTDLASHPSNGKTYAVSRHRDEGTGTSHLYEINVANGQVVSEIGDTGQFGLSSIDFALNETLYGNSDGDLVEIDITDASVTSIGSFGPDPLEPFSQKTRLKGNWMQNADGSIQFDDTITLPSQLETNVSAGRVEILANHVMVNSVELPFLDEPARITLENLGGTYRKLLVDPEDDGSFVSCDPSQCKFISFLDGTLVFDVKGFSTYSSEENADPSLEFIVATILAEINLLLDEAKSKSAKKKLKAASKAMSKARKFIKKDDVKKALTEIAKAVKNLKKVKATLPTASTLIELLVDAASTEAQQVIDDAIAIQGDPALIDVAQASMTKAQNKLAQGRPDQAINFYRDAWVSGRKSVNFDLSNIVFSSKPVKIDHPSEHIPFGCKVHSLQDAIPVRLNDDKYQDFIVHYWCDLPASKWGTVITEPTPDVLVAFVSDNNGKYTAKNNKVFGKNNPKLGGASRKFVRGDINGDGFDDFAFAMNWEDGRSGGPTSDISLTVSTEPSVLLSGPDYSYSVHRLGQISWGHAVEMVDNNLGTKDVIFAGFTNVNVQAFRFHHDDWVNVTSEYPSSNEGADQWANTFRALPSETPGFEASTIFGTYSDNTGTGAALFTKSESAWSRSDEFILPVEFEIDYINWSNDLTTTSVLTIDGQQLVGGAIDESCIMKSFEPGANSIVVAKLSAEIYPLGEIIQGQTYSQSDNIPVIKMLFFEIVDNSLVLLPTPIVNEEQQNNANFYDCTDVNNDGYDDLVVRAFSSSYEGRNNGGLPVIYINDHRGSLVNIDLSGFPRYTAEHDAQGYFLDVNSDELPDLVLFPTTINQHSSNADIHIHHAKEL